LNLPFFKQEVFWISPAAEILEQTTGDNARGVAIIAKVTEETSVEEMNLLSKILRSVNLDDKKDILLWKGPSVLPFNAIDLCRQTDSKTLLLFGFPPAQVGLRIQLQKYTPFSINGIQGLWSDSLSDLEKTKGLKNALWSGLQTLFLQDK
jgi:DNA polymerase III psi subunit